MVSNASAAPGEGIRERRKCGRDTQDSGDPPVEGIAHGYIKARDKEMLQNRLRRIEGQVRGLQRMVDEESYCIDVLTQIASVVSALEKGTILLKDHVEHCVGSP